MARPSKNNCDYFPHHTTMRNHRKVKALRNKFGAVLGYAFWSMFIEYLTGLDGNEFELSNLECEMFAAELGVSASEIDSMVRYCIEIELLFINNGFVSSESLDEYLLPVYEKRGKAKEQSKRQSRNKNGSFGINAEQAVVSVTETPKETVINSAEMPQSKVNRIKEDILCVVQRLNEVSGRAFRATTSGTSKPISGRLNDGFSVEDCYAVIDFKVRQWLNDSKMSQYIRPSTLFGSEKFEGYLMDAKTQVKKQVKTSDNYNPPNYTSAKELFGV